MGHEQAERRDAHGVAFLASSDAHFAMQQATSRFMQMQVGPNWPSSSYMRPQGLSGLLQPPYSVPRMGMLPGYAATASTPSSSQKPLSYLS